MIREWFAWLNEPGTISTGFAGLVASLVVALGWLINSRKERRAYRIDKAHDTLLVKNKKFMASLKVIRPRMLRHEAFQFHTTLDLTEEGKAELTALWAVLNELETLGLDISTGRGSELYTIETQRSLICDVMVLSQAHIEHLRVTRGHHRLLKNLEILFFRLYFNRYPVVQILLETIVGRPLFSYSYLNFRMRYLLACAAFGAPLDYRQMSYPAIRDHMRRLRRVLIAFWTAIVVAGLAFLTLL